MLVRANRLLYCQVKQPREATIKAIVIREFGPAEVMHLEEVPTPDPGPGEVLVEVAAVSVNRTLDCIVRAGKYQRPVKLPHVPGVDPVGTVVVLGDGVTTRKLGERVAISRLITQRGGGPPQMLGVSAWGGYAEYVKMPAEALHPIPDNVDFLTACVVARHAPLAHAMLRDKAQLKAGDWVLIMGASGGLGSFLVQVARYIGANVIAAAGTDHHVEVALDLGAQHGINYRTQDLTTEVMKLAGADGVQVVCENIADPDLFPKAFATLGQDGRLVTAGSHGGGIVPLNVTHMYQRRISLFGTTGQTEGDMALSLKATSEGRLRALIDQVLPLSKAVEAHKIVEGRGGTGKVLLTPG